MRGSAVVQCNGLFDPPDRLNQHYHTQAAAEFIGGDPALAVAGPASGDYTKTSVDVGKGITDEFDRWAPAICIQEDNTTCILAFTIGENPTMKDLERCFGISLACGH